MILVTGATGKVGRQAVEALLTLEKPVRALTRHPGSAALPPGVKLSAGSPQDVSAMTAALDGVDAAFVVLAGDLPAQARSVASAVAVAGGVKRLVLLSSSAVLHPLPHQIGEQHREAERVLSDAAHTTTLLRPGPFHSNSLWWAEGIRKTGRARCLIGNRPGAPIDPADVAAVGVAALIDDRHAGQSYELTGPEVLSSADQVRVLEDVLGRRIDLDVATLEEAVAVFSALSDEPATAEANVRALHSPEVPWGRTSRTGARILGRPLRTFRDWAVAHRTLFA